MWATDLLSLLDGPECVSYVGSIRIPHDAHVGLVCRSHHRHLNGKTDLLVTLALQQRMPAVACYQQRCFTVSGSSAAWCSILDLLECCKLGKIVYDVGVDIFLILP